MTTALAEEFVVRVEGLGTPALACNREGRVVGMSPEARALVGNRLEPGRAFEELGANQREAEELGAAWRAARDGRVAWSHEFHSSDHEGTGLDLHLIGVPLGRAGSKGEGWLVLMQNQTSLALHARQTEIYAQELSRLYRDNRHHLQQLEAAESSREHFFSLVSHELKTPLTSQKAALEMLSRPDMRPQRPEDARRLMQSLERSTQRLERAIRDMLDLATARSGKLSLECGSVDLVDVVQSVVEEMSPQILERGLALRWRPSRSRPLPVWGDWVRLQQVVQNLLSNAVKAAPAEGTVRIGVNRKDRRARLSVTNPGVSLDPRVARTLFEPFVKSTDRRYSSGAGLGLAVVRELVSAHRGTVGVSPGRRQVTFTVTLPLSGEQL